MKQFHTKGRENSGNCACFPPAHEPPPLPPFGHPLPLGGGEGRGEGGRWVGSRSQGANKVRGVLSWGERDGVRASDSPILFFTPSHISSPPIWCRSQSAT